MQKDNKKEPTVIQTLLLTEINRRLQGTDSQLEQDITQFLRGGSQFTYLDIKAKIEALEYSHTSNEKSVFEWYDAMPNKNNMKLG